MKNSNGQFPDCVPLYYRLFSKLRKIQRQTGVRLNESRAVKSGPKDIVADGFFVSSPSTRTNPVGTINKGAFWLNEDLASPEISNAAAKIESVKEILRSKNLRYTSSAGMF
ncbi:MAG: hypothetical protein KKH57_07170, partial [Candidatus Omnitrophica bacterium]|nr:hypothetical protein [Candidatus Omnitrophota bacterium]